jgi:hypothetical protein
MNFLLAVTATLDGYLLGVELEVFIIREFIFKSVKIHVQNILILVNINACFPKKLSPKIEFKRERKPV